jgi:glycine/sarcosine N-methyltransferase
MIPSGDSDMAPSPGARGAGYDVLVDWDRRLAREIPFLERVFADAGDVHHVIDVGCGTGRHDIALTEAGYQVTGVDPSLEMLLHARENAEAAGADVRFLEGGFGDLAGLGLTDADALICTGNALPHVEGLSGLDTALADFAAVTRPGAPLVLHFLNHERLIADRPRFLPPVVRDTADGTLVFLRLISFEPAEDPDRITIEFLTAAKDAGAADSGDADLGWSVTAHRSSHPAITFPVLRDALARAGFEEVRAFGDHSGKAYEPSRDESVIVTARRR